MKRIAAFLLTCTIAQVLPDIRPGAAWVIRGNQYADLEWLDKTQTKPTESEVNTAVQTCITREAQRDGLKKAARATIKAGSASANQKIDALILLLDLDR